MPDLISTGRSILLVDDDSDAAEALAAALDLRDYQVTVALTGAQALAHARVGVIDICLLDIHLPDMSGYQLALELRENTARRMQVIALTGDSGALRSPESAAFDHLVLKPVTSIDALCSLFEFC